MTRHARRALCLALSAQLIGVPLATHAAEAPGALTIVVRNQHTDRPLPDAKVTITESETNRARSLDTDAQGRIFVEDLDPGLYTVNITRDGFAPVYESSVRVITRKTSRVDFELAVPLMRGVVVQGRPIDALASPSSMYLDREALRSAVGGGADPLLSLDDLPGLASASEFAAFSVRGRGPRDNLILSTSSPSTRRCTSTRRWARTRTSAEAAASRFSRRWALRRAIPGGAPGGPGDRAAALPA